MKTNRLAAEKSPYLLQHAANPVDWWPWGDEAFHAARKADKPVFLSIGYATCHWCHVMAHESFEDAGVARLLNDTFICIKVDREERPDIDRIYMTACQRLTGSGGWPLTVFMTPDRHPFYAATYVPRESRYGRIGLLDLIPRIGLLWKQRRTEVLEAAEGITASLIRPVPLRPERLSPGVLDHACRTLQAGFDAQWGGFGEAPKFPMPHQLLFLIRYGEASGNPQALDMARATLDAMRRGGIWDAIGGGFHRYSTDRRWLVPHFEKMLYDQALLCLAYTEAFQATGQGLYAETVREICTYVLRDLTDPGGAFHSAEDADSEGEEGKYYLWTETDIRRSLTVDEADLAVGVYGVLAQGNYRDEATGTLTGANILHLPVPLSEAASRLGLSESVLRERLASIREKLLRLREERVRPSRDDKILTDWNGLMIAALARAAQILDEPVYLAAAERAATFLLRELHDGKGRLLHRWREGEAAIPGLVDDYAFLIWGFFELYEASFDPVWLERALAVQEKLDAHFWDETEGGYFFSPDDGETVLARQKEAYDGAVPSGNAVAMLNLIRLGRISGNGLWEERARKLGEAFAAQIARVPTAHALFLSALAWLFLDAREIVVAGDPGAVDTQALLAVLREVYLPNRVVLLLPEASPESSGGSLSRHAMDRLAPFTRAMAMIDGRATAYVCSGQSCQSPIRDPETLKRLLETGRQP